MSAPFSTADPAAVYTVKSVRCTRDPHGFPPNVCGPARYTVLTPNPTNNTTPIIMIKIRNHAGGDRQREAGSVLDVGAVGTEGFGVILPAHCKSNDLVVEC